MVEIELGNHITKNCVKSTESCGNNNDGKHKPSMEP